MLHRSGLDSFAGTGFVAAENLPESEDEEDEAAGKQRISVEFAWSNEYKQVGTEVTDFQSVDNGSENLEVYI